MFICGQGIVMDCPFAKFSDFHFSHFWFYRADRQTESHTNMDGHLIHATPIGMSKYVYSNMEQHRAIFAIDVLLCCQMSPT